MFKRKKNVAIVAESVVLQKQEFVTSLPSDVWSEILRYFSRKQLCQQIYLVNRLLYDLANSRHIVPTTHVIHRISFGKAIRRRTFLNFFKPRIYNCVRFGHNYDPKTLDTQQLRKMPAPKPFVHFRKVYIWTLLDKSTLKFLRDAKESFAGSVIHYFMPDILDNKDMRNQTHYKHLQNVFQKPSHISLSCSYFWLSELKVFTDGLPNCSRIKLQLGGPDDCNDDIIRMFLDWLSIANSMVHNPEGDTGKKHLVLHSFPRRSILDLVQHIKDAFVNETLLFFDFVITFVSNKDDDFCLEGDHKFILNKISTNERLSFFTHSHFPGCDDDFGLVYRLWCRRVVNEAEDLKMTIHLQNIEEWFSLGIDLDDYDFYHFNYPLEHDYYLY